VNPLSQAKAAIAYLGNTSFGISGREIARYFYIATSALASTNRAGNTAVEEHGLIDVCHILTTSHFSLVLMRPIANRLTDLPPLCRREFPSNLMI